MLKLTVLNGIISTLFVALTTQTALALPLNPVVQNSDSNTPFCYMKTTDGRILDLRNICGFASPAACSDTNIKPEIAILLKDFCKQNQRCQITSTCNAVPQNLEPSTRGEFR
ncbi:MAG: hypothetical protein WBG73_23315 [Coleofasciculaceae cyanobacterium]